jgi:hypothetical protein
MASSLDDLLAKYSSTSSSGSALDALESKYSKTATSSSGTGQFADVVGGSRFNPFANVEAGADTNLFPNITNPYLNTAANFLENAETAIEGQAKRAAASGLLAASVPMAAFSRSMAAPDSVYQTIGELSNEADQDIRAAEGAGGFTGNILGQLGGGFLFDAGARGIEAVNKGKSIEDAEKDLAIGAGVNVAGVGLGLPFARAQGLLGVAQRAAFQVPGSVALTAGERALQGEELTNADIAMAIGGGLFGSLFREPPRISRDVPSADSFRTGDDAFDAGLSAVDDTPRDLTKIDVSNQKEFRQQFDPGWTWKPESGPKVNLTIDGTPLDSVRAMNEVEQAYANRARERTDANFLVSDRQQNAQEISRAMFGDEPAPVELGGSPTNRPLATEEMSALQQALLRRRTEREALTPEQPEGVNVSLVDAAEELRPNSSGRLGRQRVSVDETGATVPESVEPTKAAPKSVRELFDAAQAKRNLFDEEAPRPSMFVNNGSGESSASVEAMNRIADEKVAGQHRMVIEPNGNVRPLLGVDAVDYFPKKGEIVVQRNIGKNEWTSLYDSGLGKDVEAGRINASSGKLKEAVDDLEMEPAYKQGIEDEHDFRKTMYGSKIKDSDGRYQVVYHGRGGDFGGNMFDPKVGDGGMHFGTKEQANTVANTHGRRDRAANIVPVYLNIKNPKRVTDQIGEDGWAKAIAQAKEEGHDGLVYKNEYEGAGDSYVAFYPQQVISAIDGGSRFKLDPSQLTDVSGRRVFSKPYTLPASVANGIADNNLVGRTVLDSIADNHGNMFDKAPEARAWVEELRELGKKFGGLDTPIRVYDKNNADHVRVREDPNGKGALAVYDPRSNQIVLFKDVDNATLVHEVGHAITMSALYAGKNGVLKGKAAQSYAALDSLFNSLKEPLSASSKQKAEAARLSRGDNAAARVEGTTSYGLTNLDEFMSEMFSNQTFRDHLRQMKLTPELSKTLPGYGRLALGKVRNVYDAVVKLVRNVLGLSPKADNALDAMFSASKKFFSDIDDVDTQSIRNANARNTTPAFAKGTPETQQQPRSTAAQIGRAIFFSQGLEPVATAAQKTRQNINALGELKAVQAMGRLKSVTTNENRQAVADALHGNTASFKSLSPEARTAVREAYESNYDLSMSIVKEILDDPNMTPKMEAVARKILENAGTYQTRAYRANESKTFMKDSKALYDSAKNKIANGKELTAAEAETHNIWENARKKLSDTWLPDLKSLNQRDNAQLEDLYKFHTGLNPDQQFNGFSKADRKEALVGAVAERLRNITNKDEQLDAIVNAAAGLNGKRTGAYRHYQNLRRDSNIYATLDNVPKELREFWGEITDPIARTLSTVRSQYSYLANLKAQNQLRADGMGRLFSQNREGVHTESLQGETLGPLQGLFTTPDVKRAVEGVFVMDKSLGDMIDAASSGQVGDLAVWGMRQAMRPVRAAAGATKLMSVVTNPSNYVHNFIGSPVQVISNGNINPATWAKGGMTMAKLMKAERSLTTDPDVEDVFRYGLAEYSQLEELRKSRAAQRIDRYLQDIATDPNPLTKAMRVLNDARRAGSEGVKEVYAAMDLWSKFANWHNELDFWTAYHAKHNPEMSLDDIKRQVAARINDTNITPSLAPKAIKELESLGVTKFGTYYSEVARTLKNNFVLGTTDLYKGIQTGDPSLTWHGAKRLTGVIGGAYAHQQLVTNAALAGAGAVGLAAEQLKEDSELRKYMRENDFLSSIDPLLLKGKDNDYVYDLSRANPFAPIWTPASKLMEATQLVTEGRTEEASKLAKEAVKNLTNLVTPNTFWKGLDRAISGGSPSLKRTAEPTYNDIHKVLTNNIHLSSDNADRIISAMEPFAPALAKNIWAGYDNNDPTMKMLVQSGAGVSKLDVASDLGKYIGRATKDELLQAKAAYADLMKQNYKSSEGRLEEGILDTIEKSKEAYAKLQLGVNAAREQGSTRMEIAKQLKQAGFSKEMMGALIANKPLPLSAIVSDLSQDVNADMLAKDSNPAEKAAIRERYKYNVEQMRNLLRKHKNEL